MNANKNIRKLKSQQILLQFPNPMCLEECSIICFADATFANLKNSSSQEAFIVYISVKIGRNMLEFHGNEKRFKEW